MQAFFPGRMSSLSAALCWPFLLHQAPGRVTGPPRLSLSCWQGWGQQGTAPVTPVAGSGMATLLDWWWPALCPAGAGAGAQSRTEAQQTPSPLDFIFPALESLVCCSCVTPLMCHASHVSHLSCDTLELLLLQTEIYFPSHKFIQLLFKARLHSHALLLHFLTDLVCSPRISSLGWFKGSTSPFPCEITQCCSLASIPCCCVRAAPGPSQPLPCSLNEPISIPSFVYGHPIPLLLTIFLYACFSCEFTFL